MTGLSERILQRTEHPGCLKMTSLGIDLTLSGHTHGGQLYVNRGIGTTMFPIRIGARPEITVLELSRT
jgi:predicted MPP superfamily phosphohydrolase